MGTSASNIGDTSIHVDNSTNSANQNNPTPIPKTIAAGDNRLVKVSSHVSVDFIYTDSSNADIIPPQKPSRLPH